MPWTVRLQLLVGDFATAGSGQPGIAAIVAVGYLLLVVWFVWIAVRLLSARADVAFFIDPPYTAGKKRAGSRLYRYHEVDHARLFRLAAQPAGDFLMTYDQAEEIEALAAAHGLRTAPIPMTTTHRVTTLELLVGRNLDWLSA